MTQAEAKISHLARFHPRNRNLFVCGLSVDVSDEARRRGGSFVGVIRAECPMKVGEALAAHIEDAVVRGLSDALRNQPADATQERLFEAAVGKVNDTLYRLLGEDGLPVDADKVAGVLLSQSGPDVVAAIWGQPSILLFHPTSADKIQAFDLLEDDSPAPAPRGFGFAHLIAGSIGRRDRLVIATDELRNAIGAETLARAVINHTPEEATQAVRDALSNNKSALSAALAVAALDDEAHEAAASESKNASATQHSIESLLQTQNQTNAILSPSPLTSFKSGLRHAAINMSASLKQLKDRASNLRRRPTPPEEAVLPEEQTIPVHAPTKPPTAAETAETVLPVASLDEAVTAKPIESVVEPASDRLTEPSAAPPVPETAATAESVQQTVLPMALPPLAELEPAARPSRKGKKKKAADKSMPQVEPSSITDHAVSQPAETLATETAPKTRSPIKVTAHIMPVDWPPAPATAASEDTTAPDTVVESQRVETRSEASAEPEPGRAVSSTIEQLASTEPLVQQPAAKPIAVPLPPPQATAAKPSAGRRLAAALFTAEGRRRTRRACAESCDRGLGRLIEKFNALPPKSRWLLIGLLAVILALNASLGVAGWRRMEEEKIAAYDRTVSLVNQKLDSAESSLLYNNETHARELIDEAVKLCVSLPERTAAQRTTKDQLQDKIESKKESLRHAVRLPEPDTVATVASAGGAVELFRLAGGGEDVWAASRRGDVFRISLKDGRADKRASTDQQRQPNVFIALADNLLFGGDDGQLRLATAAGKVYDRPAELPDKQTSLPDGSIYANKLYLLDPTHNRILRYNVGNTGFVKPQYYLKDATDVSKAVSLVVDGAVWVLTSDGQITKLTQGTRAEFSLGPADPALGAVKRVRTEITDTRLYVLDTNPGRVLAFDKKTGLLSSQFEADQLKDATDILVDEKRRQILAVVGDKLYRFTWPEGK